MFNLRLCNAATIRYSLLKFWYMHLCGKGYKYFPPHCCKCNSFGCIAAIRCCYACHRPHSDSVYSGSKHRQFNSPRLVKREAGFTNPQRALIGSNQLWRVDDSPYYREFWVWGQPMNDGSYIVTSSLVFWAHTQNDLLGMWIRCHSAHSTVTSYEHDCVSNHQSHVGLLNHLFGRGSKKTSKLLVTGLCAGNSPVTGEFPHKGPVTRKKFRLDDAFMQAATQKSRLMNS